jgi:1,2-phenylacetyl-CoA epoxidase catalytic subunit
MTKRLSLSLLALILLACSGCVFSKKTRRVPESAPATEVEQEFRQRFVAKRTAELTAKGLSAPAAQEQARREFNEKYGFTKAAK